jgi:hypothetical protein
MDFLEVTLVAVVILASAAYAVVTLLPRPGRLALARVLQGRAPQWIISRLTRGTGCDTCAGNPALRPPTPRR